MSLKEILLASREAGDYTPAWEQLVNTKVFVSVLTNDSGPTTSDFRFEIAKSEQDGNPYVVVSDNLDDLARCGRTTAIRENAYKLMKMTHPGLGMIVALGGGEHFYIPPGLIDWIRKSAQVVADSSGGEHSAEPDVKNMVIPA